MRLAVWLVAVYGIAICASYAAIWLAWRSLRGRRLWIVSGAFATMLYGTGLTVLAIGSRAMQ